MKFQRKYSLLNLTICLISFLVLISPVRSEAQPECQNMPFGKGKLWEIQKDNGPKSYVFGTMHSKDPRILHLPGVVMQALNKSDTFILETQLTRENVQKSRQLMLSPFGQNLRELVGPERHDALKPIMRDYGMTIKSIEQFKIWAIASILSQPPSSKSVSKGQLTLLDRELERFAQSQGKAIHPLETAEEQLGLFDNLTEQAQLELLDAAIKAYPDLDSELETLTQHYLRGEINWFFCNMEEDLQSASPELVEFLEERLILKRNETMTKRMIDKLETSSSFVAVGALHLPGERGILNLLKIKGYSLRRRF
ncbi:TraB/GumN family protein [Sneathiella limimaris]|uniref:TraB/GumN family protein n=1 Tax=Sneathiella limimaris TaxID=1964213 RepID=UPI00146DFF25|nr:TraB/GumN family protein [Sneathiella limimaris]